jgi:thiol-disulfide isomerase/thioredoxin
MIVIDGSKIPFTLIGDHAQYNRADNRVAFGRNGSGKLETYKISDRYVNLAGKTYAFTVDAGGNTLTLEESATPLPERPALETGTQAPAFTATDIDHKTRRLEDYRGRLLLLEFWSTSCGPCRVEAPRMREFLKQNGIS